MIDIAMKEEREAKERAKRAQASRRDPKLRRQTSLVPELSRGLRFKLDKGRRMAKDDMVSSSSDSDSSDPEAQMKTTRMLITKLTLGD